MKVIDERLYEAVCIARQYGFKIKIVAGQFALTRGDKVFERFPDVDGIVNYLFNLTQE